MSRKTEYKLYILVLFVAYWIAPTIIICICYIVIVIAFKRSSTTLSAAVEAEDGKRQKEAEEEEKEYSLRSFCEQQQYKRRAEDFGRQIASSALGLVQGSALFSAPDSSRRPSTASSAGRRQPLSRSLRDSIRKRKFIATLHQNWRDASNLQGTQTADKVQVCKDHSGSAQATNSELNLSKSRRPLEVASASEVDSTIWRRRAVSFAGCVGALRRVRRRLSYSAATEAAESENGRTRAKQDDESSREPPKKRLADRQSGAAVSLPTRRQLRRQHGAELFSSPLIGSTLNFDAKVVEEASQLPEAARAGCSLAAAANWNVAEDEACGSAAPSTNSNNHQLPASAASRSAAPTDAGGGRLVRALHRAASTGIARRPLLRQQSVALIAPSNSTVDSEIELRASRRRPNDRQQNKRLASRSHSTNFKAPSPLSSLQVGAANSRSDGSSSGGGFEAGRRSSGSASGSWRNLRMANLRVARANMQYRLATMSLYLILLWLISWTPIAALAMVNFVFRCHRVSSTGVFIANTMTKLGPTFDVFIYGISHPNIKSKFKKIIMRLFMLGTRGAVAKGESQPFKSSTNEQRKSLCSLERA